MFNKILIANRGEIACRILRTARRLGIATVAVYSTADADALHVSLADEAVLIGPPAPADSYLHIANIVQACRDTGADAVHPGYGFLSENPQFPEQLAAAGVAFIGPSADAMRRLGDKVAAKQLAVKAGVPTVPGQAGTIRDAAHAVELARQFGYPVMLKAAAGGGGRGMRLVTTDEECRDGFTRAANEGRAAFGDARLFLEKYIARPRHVEIQIMADRHGHVIHLGERECSVQRRHQKVIEEAPAPNLSPATRAAMGAHAVALARAAQYSSAGTVEFLVDDAEQFYFLEMNTRLQVEHPVTEWITGLDLVELMIRVAAGEPLPLTQDDVTWHGWAVEARVYAEDPFRQFLPAMGRLVRYAPPVESPGLRIDTGVYEGGEVSVHYDALMAKVITHAPTRSAAIDRLREALNRFCIRGVAHNISFLSALIEQDQFRQGRVSTQWIADTYPQGFRARDVVHDEPALLVAVAASIHRRYTDRAARISGQLPGYERRVPDEWVVTIAGHAHSVSVTSNNGGHDVDCAGTRYRVVSEWQFGQPLFSGTVNGEPVAIQVERHNLTYRLFHWGAQIDATVLSARAAELMGRMQPQQPPDLSRFVLSPMPGLLAQLRVGKGEEVLIGQPLAVVEAMKMENVLFAERAGRIAECLVEVGQTLAVDQPILEFE